jgi:TolB-like protein
MRIIYLFLLISALTGCGSTSLSQFSTESLGSMPRKAAVFPLANLTTHPYAGQIVGELLFTELKNVHQLSVMSNAESWKAFQGKETDLEEAALHQNVRQAALQLGVDAAFFGSVTEYRYKRGVDEEPVVGVTIRLMDVATGNILWGASLSKAGGCCSFGGDTLSSTAQKVCKDLVNSLLKESLGKGAHKFGTAG